jgi:hypothetical protein
LADEDYQAPSREHARRCEVIRSLLTLNRNPDFPELEQP